MARPKKTATKSSVALSVTFHALAIGAVFYWAARTGMIPDKVSKFIGITPEKKKEEEKKKEPDPQQPKPQDTPPATPPPTTQPVAPQKATARAADANAPRIGGNSAFVVDARPPDAKPVQAIVPAQGQPQKPAPQPIVQKSTVAASTAKSAFSESATKPSTVESVLEDRKSAAAAQDSISAEQIARTGGGDAAQIVTKVTGVTTTDGKFTVVRGLSDRYNSTTLNGAEIPSSDPYRKGAQLDMIPSAMIDRVLVNKTFTPDQPGGFAGGSVNIVTKSFPDHFFYTSSVGMSYNTQATGNGKFISDSAGGTDWLGMDDGTRALPSILENTTNEELRQLAEQARRRDSRFTNAQKAEWANTVLEAQKSLRNVFAPERGAPGPNNSFGISSGDTSVLFGKRYGWFGSLSYDRKYSFYDEGYQGRFTTTPDGLSVEPRLEWTNVTRGVAEVGWSGVVNNTIEWMPGHEAGFNFIYNQNTEDRAILLRGKSRNLGHYDGQPGEVGLNFLQYTERNLQNYQIRGRDEFPELASLQMDWLISLANTSQDEPDFRLYPMQITPDPSSPTGFGITSKNGELPNTSTPSHFFRNLEEQNQNYKVDWTLPFFPGNGLESALKAGLFLSDAQRIVKEKRFSYVGVNGVPGDPETFPNQEFSPDKFTVTKGSRTVRGEVIDFYTFSREFDPTTRDGTYDATQTIQAGYLMTDLLVLPKLRLIGGARLETTEMVVNGINFLGQQSSGVLDSTDWLPSASAVYSITTNLNLRLSYSSTIARPSYREKSPFGAIDPDEATLIEGNPALDKVTIENWDSRLEWYPRPGELLSVSTFYKTLTNPIERFIVDTTRESYTNRPWARVVGIEFEARKSLEFLDSYLEDFTLGGNLALIKSVVEVENGATRALFDQAPYIINFDLTYNNQRRGTSVSLVYSESGERVAKASINSPEIYEQPAPSLDFFISQRLNRTWRIRFSARNLLDPEFERLVGKRSDYNGEFVFSRFTRGITFGLSLTAEF